MEPRGQHRQRREAAYRRAADAHRRAETTELMAADFFAAHGRSEAAARHRENAVAQHQRAGEDDARAAAVTVGS
jgi:hypothetical protein